MMTSSRGNRLLGCSGDKHKAGNLERTARLSGKDRLSALDRSAGACSTSAVDESAKASTPALVLGRYLLGAELGQGGMGRVHRATDTTRRDHNVAVKTLVLPDVAPDLKEQLTERFKREPEILALIKHKHVVDVLNYGSDADGTLHLVTELLEGENLNQHLRARGEPLPVTQATDLALELCAGIQACHESGVIHRDLKPDNVFLVRAQTGSGWEVKIIDFGLAKGQHAERLTRAGIVPGTLRFFSPEQAAGEEATEQTDQYSIALCLYFCVTGHEPFDQLQGGPMELIRAIHNSDFPRPRSYRAIPEALEAIILRAMHREPSQRFPSVSDLGRALWPFAGAAHRELWRAEYGPDSAPLPEASPGPGRAEVTSEAAGPSAWWHRFVRRRR
jgi:eukaryotic-like serine/threonine-protein kinase